MILDTFFTSPENPPCTFYLPTKEGYTEVCYNQMYIGLTYCNYNSIIGLKKKNWGFHFQLGTGGNNEMKKTLTIQIEILHNIFNPIYAF